MAILHVVELYITSLSEKLTTFKEKKTERGGILSFLKGGLRQRSFER